ncbi:LysR substrate-binding domain-containing protein [Mailhella massiliensis]|uniref:LysR substrate-binding domain-containing protein n=1 Tax=Mailhella massiliensis TaxID=1903261 RepID=UPI00097D51A9|nr:LysR substrate-binding domain-containing protein [Mailhella massiliensis]
MLEMPPLNALAAFEAAARLGSFTRAGEELCVTQAAVSQHIRRLEEYLGAPLFIRHAPGIRLTPDGERYYRTVSGALEALRRESARIRRGSGPLSVVAEASFANRWLAPRLSRFCERFSDIDLRIAPHPSLPELGPEADIVIRRDMPASPGLYRLPLPPERLFPVCAPGYAKQRGEAWKKDRLLRSPEGGEEDWNAWFSALGERPALSFGPMFQFAYMALAAASEGRGAALGTSLLVAEDLRAGRLVTLGGAFVEVARRYVAACPVEACRSSRVKAFFQWMREELEKDRAEFPGVFPPEELLSDGRGGLSGGGITC